MAHRIKFRDCDKTLDALLLKSGRPDEKSGVDIVLTGNIAYFCNPGSYSASEAAGMIYFMQAGEDVKLSGTKIVSNKTEIGYVLNKEALHMACETALAHKHLFDRLPWLAPLLRNLLILAKKHPLNLRYTRQDHERLAWQNKAGADFGEH